MKTFKQFLEEASNSITRFGSSGHQLKTKGIPHPDHLDMPHIFKWIYGVQKKAKRRDVGPKEMQNYQDKLNKEYFNSPQINPPGIDPLKKIKA